MILEIQPDKNIDENQCGNEDMTFVLQDIDVTASDHRRITLNVIQEKENPWIPWPLISLKSKTKELQAFLPEQKQRNVTHVSLQSYFKSDSNTQLI